MTVPEYLSDVAEGHEHTEAFRNDLRAARTWTELAIDVWNGRDLFPDVVRDRGLNMVINDLVQLGRHVERLEGILFDLEVSNANVDEVISNIDLVLNRPEAGRELMQRAWNDTVEMLQKHTERTEEIPFQRYRVPREEPSPSSVPITLNMGFDPTNVVRLAKRAAGKLTNQAKDPNPKAKGHRVAEMYKHTRDETEVSLKQQRKEIENMLRTTLIDTTSPMKEMVKRVFGEQQSQEFINRVILAKGHSVRANAFLNRAVKDIYGKLGKRKREILDEVIFSSRLIQIGRYRGNVKDFKGRSPQEHRDFLNNLEEIYGLTEREVLDLFNRAIIYFDRTLSLLDVLLEDGLISKEEYADLKTFRWTRTEALKKIDPDVKKGMLSIGHRDVSKRKQAKTKDSGIQELELGSEFDTPNIDMAYVLADWTQRVMKRSALARMSESLWDLANSQQQNEIIRPAAGNKRPADWQTTQVIVRGEKKQMYVHPEFARHWMLDTAEISPVAANVARIMSGSFILRPMATGIRLGFIPVNISRDIILQQFSAKYMDKEGNWKPTWNTFTPLGIGQQLWYIGKVAPAALFRGKKYQQYADAGGSMLFMAVQGRPLEAADIRTRFGRGAAARTAQFQHSVDRAMDTLGYLNVTSEIITRLSLVERALDKIAERDGITREDARNDKKKYEEAAAIARDYLDFGQAGSMVRAVDTFRPYTNAAFQAGRSMVRSWQRDWKHAAFQSAQVAGIASLLAVGRATYMQDEDEDGTLRAIERDIPARDLARFFIIFPFGKEMYFENEYGEKHRPYFKIPIDGALIPPKILGEVATARILGEDIRGDVIREGLQAAAEPFSPIGGIGVPSLDAYFALAYNLDTFFGGKVWTHGDMIEAEHRVTKDTPQFIKDLADTMNKAPLANVSPHQLHHAARGMSAGGTWFTHHFGQAYDHFRDVPVADRELHLWEAIADHPSSGSLINYTRADVARFDEIESWEKEHITERKQHDLYVTRESQRIREILGGELDSTVRTVRLKRKLSNYIEANAKNDDHRRRMYEVMEFYTEMPSTPRFRQWKDFIGKTPETKAKRLRRMLRDAGPTERERIFNEAKMFPHADSKAMWDEFDRLTEQEIFQ